MAEEEKPKEEKEELSKEEKETLWQILTDWLQRDKETAKKKLLEVE